MPALLEALEKPVDRSLEHALIYALIEIGDPASVRDALKHDLVQVRRAAMIGSDQMPGDGLPAEKVIDALSDAIGRPRKSPGGSSRGTRKNGEACLPNSFIA